MKQDKIAETIIISEDDMREHYNALLTWGEERNLQPEELTIVIGFAYSYLIEELGIEITSTEKLEGGAAN